MQGPIYSTRAFLCVCVRCYLEDEGRWARAGEAVVLGGGTSRNKVRKKLKREQNREPAHRPISNLVYVRRICGKIGGGGGQQRREMHALSCRSSQNPTGPDQTEGLAAVGLIAGSSVDRFFLVLRARTNVDKRECARQAPTRPFIVTAFTPRDV